METGQIGRFLIAIILFVPLLAFMAEIFRPGYIVNLLAGIWIWIFVVVAIAIVVVLIKNRIEGSSI